jgi:hypothetical protein
LSILDFPKIFINKQLEIHETVELAILMQQKDEFCEKISIHKILMVLFSNQLILFQIIIEKLLITFSQRDHMVVNFYFILVDVLNLVHCYNIRPVNSYKLILGQMMHDLRKTQERVYCFRIGFNNQVVA